MTKLKSICVFCGSRSGNEPHFLELAREMGRALAANQIRLVYGGGDIGLMGAAANSCADAGGDVIGIIPEFLQEKEIAFERGELEIVDTLHKRKARMAEESDGFIVLPGGLGTLEEVIEVLSWINLQELQQKVVLLDKDGYWDPLFALLEHTIKAGFTDPIVLQQALRAKTCAEALEKLEL